MSENDIGEQPQGWVEVATYIDLSRVVHDILDWSLFKVYLYCKRYQVLDTKSNHRNLV